MLRGAAGFSLIELLVVIAVIAVIATIAIPNLSDITRSATLASRVQNAHLVATTYNAYATMYSSSGLGSPPYTDRDSAVAAVIDVAGLTVVNPRLNTTNFFRAPIPSTNEIDMEKLAFTNGQLVYTPE